MKIISIIGIGMVVIVAISCASFNDNSVSKNVNEVPQSVEQWKAKAPELFTNIGYSKLIESNDLNQNVKELQDELIGTITNPFDIRDDILNYILITVPESNLRGRIATIKMAYYYQKQIGVKNDKELNLLSNKASAAMYCTNMSMVDLNKFINGYDKLLRNTQSRLMEQNRIEHLLNHHVISADFGIDTYDFNKQCDYFLGLNSK